MKTTLFSIFISCILLSCNQIMPCAANDDVIGFANRLLVEGDYYRAITEYKRALYRSEGLSKEVSGKALLGIGQAYFAGHQFMRAGEWLWHHSNQLDKLGFGASANELMFRAYLSGRAGNRILELIPSMMIPENEKVLYTNLSLACLGHWQEAMDSFSSMEATGSMAERIHTYTILSQEAFNCDWSNPALAGWLGVIPGVGYLYAGHHQSALASFIVNGLFTWATVEAFDTDQDVLGGFLATFTLTWYSGNIYGSVLAARRHNSQLQEECWIRFDY